MITALKILKDASKILSYYEDLQGRNHTIGTHNLKEINSLLMLPTNIIHLAMDTFWTAWTFIIGHELYHLQYNNPQGLEDELNADTYGYQILMHMMLEQKKWTHFSFDLRIP